MIVPAYRLGIAAILICTPTSAFAQAGTARRDGLTVTGSIRTRYERLDGQARPGVTDAEDIIAIRTLIQAEYRSGGWRIGGELQDSRVYGSEPRTSVTANDVNTLEWVQAYVARDVTDPFGKGSRLTATLGRQTLALGSRRLIAADEYRNTTNGSTGLRVDFRSAKGLDGTAFWVVPQRRLPDTMQAIADNRVAIDEEDFALHFFGTVVARRNAIGRIMIEGTALRFAERDSDRRASRDRRLTTLGFRLFQAPRDNSIDGELEVIGQWGEASASLNPAAVPRPVAAGVVHADIGYQWPGGTRLSVEYDHASGDRVGGRDNRFDTLFGMRRADLAPAGLYQQIGRTNIITPALRLEMAPGKQLDGFVAARAMWLASRTDGFSTTGVRDITGRSGRYAGEQVEGRIRYGLGGPWRIEANGALLHKGRFLRDAPNAARGEWVRYLSIALSTGF